MCFFKKKQIEDYMEYQLDATQHNGVYKRSQEQWAAKHKIKLKVN